MKITKVVILKIALFFCLTVTSSIAQSEKRVFEADTVKARVVEANVIYADTVINRINNEIYSKYEDSKPVHINFKEKKIYKLPKDIKDGGFYHIQIDDINMNLYKVTLQSKDSVITSSVSFPTFEISGLQTAIEVLDELSDVSITSVLAEMNLTDKESLKDYKSFKLNREEKTEKEAKKIYQDIVDTLNSYINELKTELINIQEMAIEIDTLMLDVQTLTLSYLVERDTLWHQDLKEDLNFKKFIEKMEDYRSAVYQLLSKLKNERKNYLKFYEDNKEIIEKSSDLNEKDKSLKNSFTALTNHLDKVFKSISAEKVSSWLNIIIHLDNNNDRTYRSLPIQLKGDFTDLSIDIETKDEKYGLPSFRTNFRFPDEPKWRIAASTGFYRSFNFSDDAYSVTAEISQTDTSKAFLTIKDERLADWEIGTTALFHYRIVDFKDDTLQFHGSIGPAISFTKPVKPRLIIGLGLALGVKHKMTFNGFLIVGKVDRLSKNYSLSKEQMVPIDQIPENVTVSKFKWGYGLSVGYMYDF